MSESCQETLQDVWEWLGVPPGCPGVVGSPFQMYGRPSWMSGSGLETLPDLRES